MTNFLVLYRGSTISDAKMVAVTIDPEIVAAVTAGLLSEEAEREVGGGDPVLQSVDEGRRGALRLISLEAAHAAA